MSDQNSQHFYDKMRKKLGAKRFEAIIDSHIAARDAINARTVQLKMSGRVVYPDLTCWPIHFYSKADMADLLVDLKVTNWEEEAVPAFRWWLHFFLLKPKPPSFPGGWPPAVAGGEAGADLHPLDLDNSPDHRRLAYVPVLFSIRGGVRQVHAGGDAVVDSAADARAVVCTGRQP